VKIAFVVHDYRRREGHSRYVVELATRFAKNHEVHVFANEIDPEGSENIQFHHVPAFRKSALTSILSFAVMATFRVQGEWDIIHNQGLCGWRGNVYTAHICNRAWHRALRSTLGRLTVREWVSGVTLSNLEHGFYRFAKRRHVIAVSQRIADDLRRCYHSRLPISVIHHGVDLTAFHPAVGNDARGRVRAELGIEERDFVFLFVGDMRKGGRQSIQALAKTPAAKLVFISRSAAEPYRLLASEQGVEERVRFLGAGPNIEKYYASADALLLPTHYDSFGMVVTEAMASGLAVIVSREAGASELIDPGRNGLLHQDFKDVEELSGKMRLLSEDRDLARKLGAAARRTTEAYGWDEIAKRTMQVYEQVLSQCLRADLGAHPVRSN